MHSILSVSPDDSFTASTKGLPDDVIERVVPFYVARHFLAYHAVETLGIAVTVAWDEATAQQM